jgi:BRCT domain type II-containing protein
MGPSKLEKAQKLGVTIVKETEAAKLSTGTEETGETA